MHLSLDEKYGERMERKLQRNWLFLSRCCPHYLLFKLYLSVEVYGHYVSDFLTINSQLDSHIMAHCLIYPGCLPGQVVSSTVPTQCLSFRVCVVDNIPRTINSAGRGTISRPAHFWTLRRLRPFTGLWSYQHPGVTWERISVWIEAQSFWQDQYQSMLRPGHQINSFPSKKQAFVPSSQVFLTLITSHSFPLKQKSAKRMRSTGT